MNIFRNKRFKEFLKILNVTINQSTRIIDVGGTASTWHGTGLEKNVTIININFPSVTKTPFKWVNGDACDLKEFTNKYFDIAYSNSVIEHVGSFDRQKQMASEVRRVAKKYWVQTPYKHFPLEIHFLFPFFQYFPFQMQLIIAKIWPFSFPRRLNIDIESELKNIWPLDKSQFRQLFPNADIYYEYFLGFTKSMIAVQK